MLLLLLCLQAAAAPKLKLKIESRTYSHRGSLFITQGGRTLYSTSISSSSTINVTIDGNYSPDTDVDMSFVADDNSSYYTYNANGCIFYSNRSYEYVLYPIRADIYINNSQNEGEFHVWAYLEVDAPSMTRVGATVCNSPIEFNATISLFGGAECLYMVEYRKQNENQWRTALTSNVTSSSSFYYTQESSLKGYQGNLEIRVKAWRGQYDNGTPIATAASNTITVYCMIPPKVNSLLIKQACSGGSNYVAFQFGNNVYVDDRIRVRWTGGEITKHVTENLPNGSANMPTLFLDDRSFSTGKHQWWLCFEGQTCESTISGEIRALPSTNGVTEAPCNDGGNEVYSFIAY